MGTDEAIGRMLFEACKASGAIKEVRGWVEAHSEVDGWKCKTLPISEAEKETWRKAAALIKDAPCW